ncbi:N-acetylgalactosamine-6-sulfatase [Holothuria leucospilota]|uniref:N-acetylgalactosamine-6-sulfatase n=1 Tax=Holothuria leucospilota TaxID=206669 RepID=A0A9Q1HHY9_HOLLE|nr:N-acetylgalactosamine-6-sulfatase [Holothuria leucospilota]
MIKTELFLLVLSMGVAMAKEPIGRRSTWRNLPNIIIMLMDDVRISWFLAIFVVVSTFHWQMGWGDLGCYGNEAQETPNIDKLAQEGAMFTDFYSAAATCSPSRASMLTGRLPIRNGMYSNNTFGRNAVVIANATGGLVPEEETIAEVLSRLGYRSKIIGKWHVGNSRELSPLNQGFDEFFGANQNHLGPYDNINSPNNAVYQNDKMVGRYFQEEFFINTETGESDLTRIWSKSAVEFIDANKHNPFFLLWSADGTHTVLGAHRDYLGTSQRGLYGDVIRDLDHGVGQIITRLKQLKLHRNTFVFFGSDNGPSGVAGTHGGSAGPFLCSKMTTYEGGMRVPGIFWWPGVIPPRQIEKAPANLLDIFSTILEITGGEVSNPERPLDGQSLWPILINKPGATLEKNSIFFYRGTGLYAVRVGDYKAHYWTWNLASEGQRKMGGNPCSGIYIQNFITDEITDHNDQPFLFHLGRDPGETYPIDPSSEEYQIQMDIINDARDRHLKSLEGDIANPQLNIIDRATAVSTFQTLLPLINNESLYTFIRNYEKVTRNIITTDIKS